jgi:hypothetical protein
MTELNPAADIKWELTILEIVHGFYVEMLRKALEDEVLVPGGVDADALRNPVDPAKTLANVRAWLKLLDLAITPAMVRETLNVNIDQDLAEALLRYFVRKKSHSNFDRDKTDFLVTYLYRNPRVKGQWESRGYSMDGAAPMPPFEIALLEILEDSDIPDISPDHARTLDEFEYLRDEVDNFRDFDAITDSDIIQRVRQMKDSFGSALYHPHVLAVIAPYNTFFSAKFDDLFKAATAHIKNFADQVQQKGGSIHAQVHGDITVKHLTEVRGNEILASEYLRAQEKLRHVSKLKKAVDTRNAAQRSPHMTAYGAATLTPPVMPKPPAAPPPIAARPAVAPPLSGNAAAPQVPTHASSKIADPMIVPGDAPRPVTSIAKKSEEENRLTSVQESVRSFVRTADPRFRSVVPMGFGNLVLTPAESDAYCADYLQESSFRGENARVLVRIPALIARMTSEIEQIERQQNLKYLWRPHAEALTILVAIKDELGQSASKLIQLATQRGLAEKINVLNNSLQKLNAKSGQATALLSLMNSRD